MGGLIMESVWFVDKVYLVLLGLFVIAGSLFIMIVKKQKLPICFFATGVSCWALYLYFHLTSQTWAFWKAAFGSDPKRIIDAQKTIDMYSSSIFNNVFISLSAIWLLGLFLWEYKIRDIAYDIVKKEEDNSISLFYFSCLFLFTAQIIIGYYWPNLIIFNYTITNSAWGFIKHILRILVAVAPVLLSFYFCTRYWGYLEEELEQEKFNESIYPTLMIAQGTFYTFVGVSAILLIYTGNKDISQILQGLKLAFLTSVIGLLFSIAARFKIMASSKEFYSNKAKRIPLDEYDFYALLNGKMLPVFYTASEQLKAMNMYIEQNNSILKEFGDEIVHTNRDMAKEQTLIFTQKLEEVFGILRKDMGQISTISKDISINFKTQKEETSKLIGKIKNLSNTVPDLYGAAQDITNAVKETTTATQNITKAVQETTAATTMLAEHNTIKSLPNILETLNNLTSGTQRLNEENEKMYSNTSSFMNQIGTISKEIYTDFQIQKDETTNLITKIKELSNTVPDLYGAAQGITNAVNETTIAAKSLAENDTIKSLPNILETLNNLTSGTKALNEKIEKLFLDSGKYIEQIASNGKTIASVQDNTIRLRDANTMLGTQLQNYVVSLKTLNQLVDSAGLIKLPELLKDTSAAVEKVGMLNSYTQTMYTNIESNIGNIEKSAEAVSAIADSVEKVTKANHTLSKDITDYKDAIGKLNLPVVAATLTRLSESYGNLDAIRTRDYDMLKNYDKMLETQKSTLSQQINLLNETIDVIKRSQASYVGSSLAMANLGQRINANADNIVSTLGDVDDRIRRQSLELEQKRYEEMLQQQKKYLKDLAAVRDETMRASLDVTNEVLNRVQDFYKENR